MGHRKTDAVLKLIHTGQLRAVNVSAGKRPTWRIDPADLEQFLADRRAVPVRAARWVRRPKLVNVTKYF
jgi:hypothetical protein